MSDIVTSTLQLPDVAVVKTAPRTADAVAYGVAPTGAVPRAIGLSRAVLTVNGFTGKAGETLVVPTREGATIIVVGVGDEPTIAELRNAAASAVRAGAARAHVALALVDAAPDLDAADAAQAVVEGALLASYRYRGLKTGADEMTTLNQISVVVSDAKRSKAAAGGAGRGAVTSRSARLAREFANMPPNVLPARSFANYAVELAHLSGLTVEVFNKDQLAALGCGGILGVNAGSAEPPRMVKLAYTPKSAKKHVALVGKGVMYDSGGISLKPSNPSHGMMKMDMSGAAAVLATMTSLRDLGCKNQVTAWLMCTDNMPSGSALKLGDVLTIRNGKTVEVQNTDAEGRLILADGLSLASETTPDAIVDIATLTGSAQAALGEEYAAVIGNSAEVVAALAVAAEHADEPIWELPLSKDRYRKLLNSNVADMKNVGGPYAGAITASIFLSEFVGDIPWAHLDIAGPMNSEADSGWKSKGATGFGTRILIDFATGF